jgi:hypothetical protein
MKKILMVLLLSGLLFACGGNEDKPAEEAAQEQIDSVEAVTEATVDSVEAAAEVVTDKIEEKADAVKPAKTGGETTKPTNAGLTGKVVKMTDFLSGNYEALSVARVKELVMAGQYVGFLANGTFYMVYNAAGNYDWKGLAKVADKASVTIEGKVSKVNGVSIIMATNIAG